MVDTALWSTATGSKAAGLATSSLKAVAPGTDVSPKTIVVRPDTPASSTGAILSGLPINAFAPQSLVT